jgi:hypothetical protein
MKKLFFLSLMILSVTSSCSSSKSTTYSAYECPMNCEKKTYDKPGTCPVCGMELEGIESKK